MDERLCVQTDGSLLGARPGLNGSLWPCYVETWALDSRSLRCGFVKFGLVVDGFSEVSHIEV